MTPGHLFIFIMMVSGVPKNMVIISKYEVEYKQKEDIFCRQ